MKNLIILILLCLTVSCVKFPCEQPKIKTMIKPSIFNAVNFSPDFNRESKFFDPSLQRVKNIISSPSDPYCYLTFFFKPATMPAAAHVATLTYFYDNGSSYSVITPAHTIVLTDGYIYYFHLYQATELTGRVFLRLTISNYDDILYSEECRFILPENLRSESVVEIKAWNNDNTHGYLDSDYPACGWFEFSELNNKIFATDKVEYAYSYGRKKILSAENYIKTRITFCNLSMYQQNLLKALCNCENLTINGVGYYLISDFTEINRDPENEICDLQAEFIEIADPTFFSSGATEMPTDLDIKNLFTI